MPDDDAGFFRNLSGLATEYVRQKRKSLQSEPETNVDSTGGGHRYSFGGQDITFDDLREIKDIRDSGGQVAQLMEYKTLLNFGEGAEVHVEDDDATEQPVDGEAMTLEAWLTTVAFPNLDLLVLDLGADALWYPYCVGELQETVTDDFKRALPAEPWTLLPKCDGQGEIQGWKQRTKAPSGGYQEQTLAPDDLWHIVINKASARDQTGISEVLRNKDEIQAFKQNEQAINKAIELHGFPQRHVKVGREEGAPVSDDDLRRVRTIFDPRTTESNTAYFTGQDVDVETLEAHNFDYSAIHEMDMRNLTTALGLPLEAGNVGSDGLGSGKPAELRFALLKLAIKANQRSFSTQFVEKVMRPVIRDHSPFDHTADVSVSINDPLEDIGDMADVIQQVGDYMTNEQVADRLDIAGPEDDEVAESYRSPADMEAAEEGDGQGGPFGGGDGFFSDGRTLQTPEGVPDNAVSISDRSEAPDGAQVVQGPGGGLYYVPGGDDGDGGGGGDAVESAEETRQEVADIVENEDNEALENHIAEETGVDNVELPLTEMSDEDRVQLASTLTRAGQAGLTDNVDEITTETPGDAYGVFNFESKELGFAWDLNGDTYNEEHDEDYSVGDDLEHLALHELGHSQHESQLETEEYAEVADTTVAVDRSGEWVGMERADAVEEGVSTYAVKNGAELVAEMFSGLAMGQEFSDEMMELYDEYDGPDTWQDYRGDN